MNVQEDVGETEDLRIEAELLVQNAGAVGEKRLLDRDAREPAPARES